MYIKYVGRRADKLDRFHGTGRWRLGEGKNITDEATARALLQHPDVWVVGKKASNRAAADTEVPPEREVEEFPDFVDLLDNSIPTIAEKLPELLLSELELLRRAEQAGKTRKGVIAVLDEEIAERESAAGGTESD